MSKPARSRCRPRRRGSNDRTSRRHPARHLRVELPWQTRRVASSRRVVSDRFDACPTTSRICAPGAERREYPKRAGVFGRHARLSGYGTSSGDGEACARVRHAIVVWKPALRNGKERLPSAGPMQLARSPEKWPSAVSVGLHLRSCPTEARRWRRSIAEAGSYLYTSRAEVVDETALQK